MQSALYVPVKHSSPMDTLTYVVLGFYCMPSEGVELSPAGHLLTDDEVVRLASLFVRNGVKKIRLTGGEPTVRKGLSNILGTLSWFKVVVTAAS